MSTNRKLTRAERRQIAAAIERAKQTSADKKHLSAQDTISYQWMWPDGICRVTDTRYTKTICYQDINYQLNQDEDKDAIFRAWCDFLNYFDSSIHVQLSFMNLSTTKDTYSESVSIPAQNDDFNDLRTEYTTMLQNQLAKGNNGLVKTKYLTFGIDADGIRAAKPRLERIETDVLNNFKRLGVKAEPMNGAERLEVMHSIFHIDTLEPFSFSWDWLPPSGLSTKDFIAPSSFEFANGRMFRIGRKFGCVSFVQILAPELNDRMLADFLDMESSMLVNLHIQSVAQTKAIKTIKRKITDLDNKIEVQRGLTTSSTAIFIPFTTQELFQSGGGALYCGLNALSNNIIMVDRKLLKNPNGLILGTPGSGKSFSAKREILNVFLGTDDDIIICDPEAEYFPLVQRLNGQVIRISPTSDNYINPMDFNMDYSDDDNPLSLKSDFILSLCELIVGGKEGLQPVEKTIIDRCVRMVYRDYLNDPRPENMPILGDLYDMLRRQEEKEAQYIATALEIYVTGSLNVFNHRTNADISNRIVCYDIKDLGKQLKKIGMLIVQDQVWNRVTVNREAHRSTRYYIDEMHLLLSESQTAAYTIEIWKRFRKWGGIPTGITQNIKDLLASQEVENIFENSDYIYMLNQASGDRAILAKKLNISPHQLSYVTQSGEGEGLLFYGNVILPFVDRFPKDTAMYALMSTKFSDLAA